MFQVKVCGIRRLEDAELALELGADAVGFVLYPRSPRYLSPIELERLLEKLSRNHSAFVAVGVVVNPKLEELRQWERFLPLGAWQIHGASDTELNAAAVVRLPVLRSLRMPWPESNPLPAACAYVLDSAEIGGTGKTFCWDTVAQLRQRTAKPLILAGGLCPENLWEALERTRPDGVDVSSGVESFPGKKDASRLKAFLSLAREWFSYASRDFAGKGSTGLWERGKGDV